MRVNPTVTWVTREAIEDVDLHGLLIRRGGIVQVLSHAIGTDPLAMAEHVPFDIRYDDRPLPSSFDGGVQHCLRHFIARTDMSVALPTARASGCRSPATPDRCGSCCGSRPRREASRPSLR